MSIVVFVYAYLRQKIKVKPARNGRALVLEKTERVLVSYDYELIERPYRSHSIEAEWLTSNESLSFVKTASSIF